MATLWHGRFAGGPDEALQALNDSLDDVKQFLHLAPNTFQNYVNIWQPAQGSVSSVPQINNFANPIQFLCGAVQAASRLGAEQSAKLCVQYLAPIIKNRQYNFLPLGINQLVGASTRPNELTRRVTDTSQETYGTSLDVRKNLGTKRRFRIYR